MKYCSPALLASLITGITPACVCNTVNSLGSDDQLQNAGRRRRRRVGQQVDDELDKYLSEPPVPANLYNGDSIAWLREVGSRRFPKLSFLAADLLSIPPSVGSTERLFS
jgi:hypothetical protein